MRTKRKFNVHFTALRKLNDMEVLSFMHWTPENEAQLREKERLERAPESVTTPWRDEDVEPQEPGDLEFLH